MSERTKSMLGRGTADALIGTIVADRYRLESHLGEGGTGTVYRAAHIRMEKTVAVKILHRQMTYVSEVVQRFEREAVVASRAQDAHLVTATDFGELDNGGLYLVLEYVPGRGLGEALEDGPMSVERSLNIARQVALALSALHAAEVVHRDVKPDNVMLTQRGDEDDFVKVLDFGMAKLEVDDENSKSLTQRGLVFGTPKYMSPEQASGSAVDHRADIYSLGMITYAMLAGHPPFLSEDISGVLKSQVEELPPPLPQTVDRDVRAIVMRLLEKDPNDRVQTAAEVARVLEALLERVRLRRGSTISGSTLAAVVGQRLSTGRSRVGRGLSLAAALAIAVALGGRESHPVKSVVSAVPVSESILPVVPSASSGVPVRNPVTVDQLVTRAEMGDKNAWLRLERRHADDRSAREWYVIGKARTKNDLNPEAMAAFLRAVEIDGKYASDRELLADVRAAADLPETAERVLRLAGIMTGASGADLLFDVWASTSNRTKLTHQAKELLSTQSVRSKASEALRVALELRDARGCEAFQALLARAITHGDTRSLRPLLGVTKRDGCGAQGTEDCFACLRDGRLTEALKKAKSRPAPTFR